MTTRMSDSIRAQIDEGITILKRGGLVAFPTDTVYGMGAAIDQPEAVARLYEVKQRPLHMALPLLLADISQIELVARRVPEVAWLLAQEFLPGALTLVLYKSDLVPDTITAGEITVAVRVPAHPVPVALIRGTGVPITGTSANRSGWPSPLTAKEVRAQLGNRIDRLIDGGRSPGSQESTIVDVTGEVPVVRREGAIPAAALRQLCNELITG